MMKTVKVDGITYLVTTQTTLDRLTVESRRDTLNMTDSMIKKMVDTGGII